MKRKKVTLKEPPGCKKSSESDSSYEHCCCCNQGDVQPDVSCSEYAMFMPQSSPDSISWMYVDHTAIEKTERYWELADRLTSIFWESQKPTGQSDIIFKSKYQNKCCVHPSSSDSDYMTPQYSPYQVAPLFHMRNEPIYAPKNTEFMIPPYDVPPPPSIPPLFLGWLTCPDTPEKQQKSPFRKVPWHSNLHMLKF